MEVHKQEEGKYLPPRKSAAIDAMLKINPDHPIAKKYLEDFEKYGKAFTEFVNENKPKEEFLKPKLKPIDPEYFYGAFVENYKFVAVKEFDESLNDYESRRLARTLVSYFIGNKSFYKSPLLCKNSDGTFKSQPDLNKGLMIIGSYGIGKTSIIETFHNIFKYARDNAFRIKNKAGEFEQLRWYEIYFAFCTTNDVVSEFEGIKRNEHSDEDYVWDQFWKKHTKGFRYYDDVMTEKVASNFGKVELFKQIFEKRYSNRAKTIISLNYEGDSVDSTLEAFAKRYGERNYDRLFEMYNIIELKGESLRK
jgi:DNA replication protein DnaC